ncbi:glycosyltransferase family 4 protein [Patescibacteria group bacterium]|nr:glycosyltransferase family 4 protein [Patescibacteria group bacterium]
MKICFLTNNLDTQNGGGRFSYELIEHVRKNIDDVVILTTVSSGYDKEHSILSTSKIKLLFSIFKIRKIIKQCDIIYALDGFPYGIIGVLTSLGLKKKIIITAIGSGSIRPLYGKWNFLLTWAYRRADVVTAISSYTVNEINKKIDIDIKIITPGISYQYFLDSYNQVDDSALKYKPYILTVGRFKKRKGQLLSLKAFAKIAKEFPDLKYVFVGSSRSAYYQQVADLSRKFSLENRVIFKEAINDNELVSFYKNAELFILLPQNVNFDIEGFGLVYLEAAAFGLPVIGALRSGATDAILDKQNGFLVEPQDVDEAAEKMKLILEDSKLRHNFSHNSIVFAKSLDWSTIIKKYLNILK